MNVHEIMGAMQSGQITPDEAAGRFKAICQGSGVIERRQFDQQERRLLLGYPIEEAHQLSQEPTRD